MEQQIDWTDWCNIIGKVRIILTDLILYFIINFASQLRTSQNFTDALHYIGLVSSEMTDLGLPLYEVLETGQLHGASVVLNILGNWDE